MAYGYSQRLAARIKENRRKYPKDIALELGAVCIKYDVPAAEVAEYLQVSRTAFYKWMGGEYNPSPEMKGKIRELIALLKKTYEPAPA